VKQRDENGVMDDEPEAAQKQEAGQEGCGPEGNVQPIDPVQEAAAVAHDRSRIVGSLLFMPGLTRNG
jgi:hypothetical protein